MDIAVFLGTAGSGKSSLVGALAEYLKEIDADFATLNLDPGVLEGNLPYEPDIDIRNYLRVEDVMRDFGLGPNGALVASMDLLIEHIPSLREDIEDFNPDLLLVDTPGQIELFAFRSTGPTVSQLLFYQLREPRVVTVFLYDPFLCRTPPSLFSIILLSESVYWRLRLPMIHVLSKRDLLEDEQVEQIVLTAAEPSRAYASADFRIDSPLWSRVLEEENLLRRELIPVSSVTGEGIQDLYAKLLEAWSRTG